MSQPRFDFRDGFSELGLFCLPLGESLGEPGQLRLARSELLPQPRVLVGDLIQPRAQTGVFAVVAHGCSWAKP
jgi:hypothetical protein